MKLKFLALSLLMVAGVNMVNAQSTTNDYVSEDRKHDIRLSVSDGLTQGTSNILGMGIADAILGTKRSDSKTSLTYGFGYRYSINRFRLGADLGFGMTSSKLALAGEKSPSLKEKDLRFLVLPTAEFVYFKRRLVELYGSAAAGVNMSRHTETALAKGATAGKSSFSTEFAYQVNPIALRVGNDRVGGFVEAGLGTKGFVTAGVSFKF
ncbi:hypothetical protein [Bacteroides caecigallinarum]|uniref:hypothetical protein n=1 Tax=Bacteroides caecigallinarum TaxID=1411144 RepID=UPI00195CED34|nr:hypothetical protein [Bacteroides caecigallinarum]MBM6882429.1 hypothetical protein [Bacteroides caecigallinarum]